MTTVHVVPHTHWDREWYLPFQAFRLQLVDVIDSVLELMDADPLFVFTLDGQLATVDDYLEIRPVAENRLRALVEAGRLAIGPWHILMDEFLVSGESIVRNLELGWQRAEELGGVMPVGYLPDMFGHVAQMPQLLRRAGIEHAVVFRGVPAAIDRHAFRWEAPDGSSVRAEYLVGGYGNAAHLFDDPDRLAAGVARFHESVRPYFGDDEPLAMVGTDHMPPPHDLVEQVERLHGAQERYRLQLETLGDYLSRAGTADVIARWRGELRSGARANMLVGVTSARIDLKVACARAERLLERYAEPLQALYGRDWPEEFLRLGWRRVIENSAHDSICGCSVDAVCDQVITRYAEAEQIAAELARRAVGRVAAGVERGSVVVLNPSPYERAGLVELDLEIPEEWGAVALELTDGTLLGTQELARAGTLLLARELPGRELAETVARMVHGRELFGRWLNGYAVEGRRLTLDVGEDRDPPELDVARLLHEIAVESNDTWEVWIAARPRRTLAATVPAPPLGWTLVRPVRGCGDVEAVHADGRALGNGLVEVAVAEDGTLRVGEVEGVGRLVDGGDFGDSYNFAPPLADLLVEEPESVATRVLSVGPVRAALAIVRTYHWPRGVRDDGSARSAETALIPVTTHVELRAGEPFVRLRVSFDNRCADHRLRFHVPLARPAETSAAEGQFAVVERGREPEGGHGEVPLGTYPARGFVDAGGVAILLDHVLEYELLDHELALTLLRSTGLISRSAHRYRSEPAGPEIAIPAAQLRGPWSVGFAVYPHAGDWLAGDVVTQAERYRHDFLTAPGGGGDAVAELGGLHVTGASLSSLRRRGDWLELRVVRESPEPGEALVAGGFAEARDADLLGRPGEPLALDGGHLVLELGAWEIRTVQLRR